MGFYDKTINGFVPYQNEEGTLPEYTDEQIMNMLSQGNIKPDIDGRPKVVPRPAPTAEEKQARYERKVESLIREQYTISQELAILRQQESKTQEYQAYYAYCEECKVKARMEVYGNEV